MSQQHSKQNEPQWTRESSASVSDIHTDTQNKSRKSHRILPEDDEFDNMLTEIDHELEESNKKWSVGSKCEVYSRSKRKWFPAEIIQCFTEDEGDWIEVKYGNNMVKEIPFSSDDIKPLTINDNALNIDNTILKASTVRLSVLSDSYYINDITSKQRQKNINKKIPRKIIARQSFSLSDVHAVLSPSIPILSENEAKDTYDAFYDTNGIKKLTLQNEHSMHEYSVTLEKLQMQKKNNELLENKNQTLIDINETQKSQIELLQTKVAIITENQNSIDNNNNSDDNTHDSEMKERINYTTIQANYEQKMHDLKENSQKKGREYNTILQKLQAKNKHLNELNETSANNKIETNNKIKNLHFRNKYLEGMQSKSKEKEQVWLQQIHDLKAQIQDFEHVTSYLETNAVQQSTFTPRALIPQKTQKYLTRMRTISKRNIDVLALSLTTSADHENIGDPYFIEKTNSEAFNAYDENKDENLKDNTSDDVLKGKLDNNDNMSDGVISDEDGDLEDILRSYKKKSSMKIKNKINLKCRPTKQDLRDKGIIYEENEIKELKKTKKKHIKSLSMKIGQRLSTNELQIRGIIPAQYTSCMGYNCYF